MGDKNIKKETKKPKKSDKKSSGAAASSVARPMMVQPEVIKKVKKIK